ncbi:hypothetical protein [Pandoraea pnomenusa]|uniref:hypothetical protein n=1 Tax=Pandoraea pnomenusa TaxID=93220 RepID=UPI0011C051EB|nr:hypothetical protein [Pandoraea pnomenusa]
MSKKDNHGYQKLKNDIQHYLLSVGCPRDTRQLASALSLIRKQGTETLERDERVADFLAPRLVDDGVQLFHFHEYFVSPLRIEATKGNFFDRAPQIRILVREPQTAQLIDGQVRRAGIERHTTAPSLRRRELVEHRNAAVLE